MINGRLPLGGILSVAYKPIFYHLWYLYALIGIYLLASLISLRVSPSWSMLAALVVLMFVLNDAGLAPVGSKIALDGKTIIYFLLTVSGAVLGQLLSSLGDSRQTVVSRSAFLLFGLFSISIAVMTQRESLSSGAFVNTFYDYTHPLVIGAAISAFTWLRLARPSRIFVPAIKSISANSLAIYGIHAFILEFVRRLSDVVDAPVPLEILVAFLYVGLSSYLTARLIRRFDSRGYFT